MFESVIVPIDVSERTTRALDVATALCNRTGARLDLVGVTSPGLDAAPDERMLEELAAGLDVPVGHLDVVEGDSVVDAIADEQALHPRSLVCMGTHARTGPAELFLGGYAGEVLRCATRPILLVGPQAAAPRTFDVVQVCIDGTTTAAAVLPAAAAFAARTGARLLLVEVLPPSGTAAPADANTLEAAAERLRGETDVFVEWEVLHGRDVAATLVDHARRLPASVVAMSTHGRRGARVGCSAASPCAWPTMHRGRSWCTAPATSASSTGSRRRRSTAPRRRRRAAGTCPP